MNGAVSRVLSKNTPKIVPPIVGTNALQVVSSIVVSNKIAADLGGLFVVLSLGDCIGLLYLT